MNTSISDPTTPAAVTTALEAAFEALKSYDRGSGRAALLPLDQAVAAAQTSSVRKQLEARLLAAMKTCASLPAREYICAKLAWIGSEASVPALAALLGDSGLTTAARNALERMPCPQASKALRNSLAANQGAARLGIINSLGGRRDEAAVPALAKLLAESDASVTAAAAAALGKIGSVKAGKALSSFLTHAPQAVRAALADAVLVGSEHLIASGHKAEARALYQTLANLPQPEHVRKVIERHLNR